MIVTLWVTMIVTDAPLPVACCPVGAKGQRGKGATGKGSKGQQAKGQQAKGYHACAMRMIVTDAPTGQRVTMIPWKRRLRNLLIKSKILSSL